MKNSFSRFKEIWFVDFEFQQKASDIPNPVCLVGYELKSGKRLRAWRDEIISMHEAPFSINDRTLFVSYFSSAELGCYLALNWELPQNILDLYVEFRNLTNGLTLPAGKSLLGALKYFELPAIDDHEKEKMRNLVLGQNYWTEEERLKILNYCESDVMALVSIFEKIEDRIDLDRALLRGEYMRSVSEIEKQGIPIDLESFTSIQNNVDLIQNALIRETELGKLVYDGLTFREEAFRHLIEQKNIPWPCTPRGKVKLDDETFKSLSEIYPIIRPIRQLRQSLSQLRRNDLTVGVDERSRYMVSPFSSKTSRNQPSNSKFIFGLAKWFRFLVKPRKGYALAYLDWSQQEFGIAAALSKDETMLTAYLSGDPYLAFAKQAGAVPEYATKESHENERNLFKSCALAVQYGMGATGLSLKINKTKSEARALIDLHRATYPRFWLWSDACTNYAMQSNRMHTVFGWNWQILEDSTIPSLKNFPMQSNGAEMLRLATILTHRSGVKICSLIHDAILIEAPIDQIEDHLQFTQEAMAHASRIILDGFALSTDVKVIRYPDRFYEKDGKQFWDTVHRCLREIKEGDAKVVNDLVKDEPDLSQPLSPDPSY